MTSVIADTAMNIATAVDDDDDNNNDAAVDDIECDDSKSFDLDDARDMIRGFTPSVLGSAGLSAFNQVVLQVTDTRMPSDKRADISVELSDGYHLIVARWIGSHGIHETKLPAKLSFVQIAVLRRDPDSVEWIFNKWTYAMTCQNLPATRFAVRVGEPKPMASAAAAASSSSTTKKRPVVDLFDDDIVTVAEPQKPAAKKTTTSVAAATEDSAAASSLIVPLPIVYAEHTRVSLSALNKSYAGLSWVCGPLEVTHVSLADRSAKNKPDTWVLRDSVSGASIGAKSWDANSPLIAALCKGAVVFVGTPAKIVEAKQGFAAPGARTDIELSLLRNTTVFVVSAANAATAAAASSPPTSAPSLAAPKGATPKNSPAAPRTIADCKSDTNTCRAPLMVVVLSVSAAGKAGKTELRTLDVCDATGSATIRMIGNVNARSPLACWYEDDGDAESFKRSVTFEPQRAPVVLFEKAESKHDDRYGHSLTLLTWDGAMDVCPQTLHATQLRRWWHEKMSGDNAEEKLMELTGIKAMSIDDALHCTEHTDNVNLTVMVPHVTEVNPNHESQGGFGRTIYLFDPSVQDYDDSTRCRVRAKGDRGRIEGLTVNNPELAASLSGLDADGCFPGAIDVDPTAPVLLRIRRAKIYIVPSNNAASITLSPQTELTVVRDEALMNAAEAELLHWYRSEGHSKFRMPRSFYKSSQYAPVYDAVLGGGNGGGAGRATGSRTSAAAAAALPPMEVPDMSGESFDE